MIINEEVIPGFSLGGIKIGEHVDFYISELKKNYSVIDEKSTAWVMVDDGLISIAYDNERIIQTVCANKKFQGNYAGLIWPGMTALQLIQNTHSQSEYMGSVIINHIGGVGMSLPEGYDDFEKFSESIPESSILEYICVFKNNWQKKKKKKKKK